MSRDDTDIPRGPAAYHSQKAVGLTPEQERRADQMADILQTGDPDALSAFWRPGDEKLLGAPIRDYRDTNFMRAALRHNEDYLDWMLRCGAPALAADSQGSTAYDQIVRNNRPQGDMMEEFARLVLLPALLLEAQKLPESVRPPITEPHPLIHNNTPTNYHLDSYKTRLAYNAENIFFPEPTAQPTDYRNKQREEIRDDEFIRQFMRPFRLTRTWDSHLIAMPRRLLPYRPVYHWDPLLQKDFTTSQGYTITCLTDSRQLGEEGEALDHCVGKSTYDVLCCRPDDTRSHILSVRDPLGNPLSTMQVMYYPEATRYKDDVAVAGTGYRMLVCQHHGQYNGSPTREATAAANEFLAMLADPERAPQYLTQKPTWLGERVEKRESHAPGKIEEYIGYTPSWEHLEKVFNEYRRPTRRASTGYSSTRLVYDDAIDPEDPQKFAHPQHFIDGFVLVDKQGNGVGDVTMDRDALHPKKGQHVVALRDLGLQDWLKATGLMQEIHRSLAHDVELHKSWAEQELEKAKTKDAKRLLGGLRKPSPKTLEVEARVTGENAHREAFLNEEPGRKISGEKVPVPKPPLRRRERQEAMRGEDKPDPSPYFGR